MLYYHCIITTLTLKGVHGTFFNLEITITESTFVCKLLDNRVLFPFSIVTMSHIERNIPKNKIFFIQQSNVSFEDLLNQLYAS